MARKERFILEELEEDNLPDVVTDVELEMEEPISDISKAEEEHFEETVNAGLSGLLTDLIKDEWEAYEGYKSAIEMFKFEGVAPEVINVLDEILGEELVHIGQLQKCLELVEPQATEIPEGEKEAEKQLAGEEGHVEETITEAPDLDGDETPNEIDRDAEKRRLGWHSKKFNKYGDFMFYFNNFRFLDAMAEKPTLEDRKKFIIDYISKDLPSYRNSNSKTGERSLWYAGPEYTGRFGAFNGKPIDKELLDKFADFILDYYKEYPDFKRNLKESLNNGKKLNEELYGNWNKNETRDGISLNLLDYVLEDVDYLVNEYFSDNESELDDEQLALYEFWREADDSEKREYVLRMCDCSYITPLFRSIQDRIFDMLGENDNYLVNKPVIDDIRMDAENRLQPLEIEESLKEDINLEDRYFKEGYEIDVASMIESQIDSYLDWDDDNDEEFTRLKDMYRELSREDQIKYCNYISNQIELGDYTWDCIYDDIRDQTLFDEEVLMALYDGDPSRLQPMEIEEKLLLRENSNDLTFDIKSEIDYRLNEYFIPDWEEDPYATDEQKLMTNLSDEAKEELIKHIGLKVYDDDGIWQEIGETIDWYITHISLEELQEFEEKAVANLRPLEIEEE